MLRVALLAMLSAASVVPVLDATAAPVQTAVFKSGNSSSGWIDFMPYANFGIFLPVKINGHDAMAWLYGGPTSLDKGFAQSTGMPVDIDAASTVNGLQVQMGDLTLLNAAAPSPTTSRRRPMPRSPAIPCPSGWAKRFSIRWRWISTSSTIGLLFATPRP